MSEFTRFLNRWGGRMLLLVGLLVFAFPHFVLDLFQVAYFDGPAMMFYRVGGVLMMVAGSMLMMEHDTMFPRRWMGLFVGVEWLLGAVLFYQGNQVHMNVGGLSMFFALVFLVLGVLPVLHFLLPLFGVVHESESVHQH